MWSLAKGYMERRNMCEVGYYCSWKYLKSIEIVILKCPNERKQSQTSFFYSLDMRWRYWRHVAMQANHWRHPHFRWRYVLSLDILLCFKCVWEQDSLSKIIKLCEIMILSLYLWWQGFCHTELFFLGSSIYCAYRWIFKRNAAIIMITIDKTKLKHMKIM